MDSRCGPCALDDNDIAYLFLETKKANERCGVARGKGRAGDDYQFAKQAARTDAGNRPESAEEGAGDNGQEPRRTAEKSYVLANPGLYRIIFPQSGIAAEFRARQS